MFYNEFEEEGSNFGLSLEDVIKRYKIKSVINLRGPNEDEKWYQDEVKMCEKYKINHYSIGFSASKLPKKKDLLRVFDILDNTEYPLLIHCKEGADRTGLISTIYKLHYQKMPLEKALEQLDFIPYGHVSIFSAKAIDDFFKLYQKFNNGKDIRTWIEEDYNESKYKDSLLTDF